MRAAAKAEPIYFFMFAPMACMRMYLLKTDWRSILGLDDLRFYP
jgi:hypothetical protein